MCKEIKDSYEKRTKMRKEPKWKKNQNENKYIWYFLKD